MHSADLIKSVLSIAASSTVAATVLSYVTSRKRNRSLDTVRRLQKVCGVGTSRRSVVNVLRQLEASGFGKFINGRRGAESRFQWREVEV